MASDSLAKKRSTVKQLGKPIDWVLLHQQATAALKREIEAARLEMPTTPPYKPNLSIYL